MSSPIEMFLRWERETPQAVFLEQPFAGQWKTWTYQQAGEEIRKVASEIIAWNLPIRSNVALLSKNCAHWMMADLAILISGHISVPLYPTLTAASILQILEHSGAKAIIIGKLDNYASQQDGIPADLKKISIAAYNIREGSVWEELLKVNSPTNEIASWDGDEVLTIMYTSGTTGAPKGVMHSANAFEHILRTATTDLGLPAHPRLFSFLPLSHIAERTGIEMIGLYLGAHISFSESLETFPKNLMDVQPNLFFAVPRLWAKFQEKILQQLPQKKLSLLLSIPVVSGIVKKSIRKKLGLTNAKHIYSGAAPLSIDLQNWFEKLGIVIFQALGMTEDCLYSHFNRAGAYKNGTVGQKLTGLQSIIAEGGELRLLSPSIMKGYYKEPELTAQSFDENGYFKTGDIAEYDSEGFLTITGRVKDQFKTDKGKYIAPAPIETKLLANTDIDQVCVVGMGIPQPIALIVLSVSGKAKPKAEIVKSITEAFTEINPTLQKYEKLEKAVIMKEDWSIENGLITPSLKVKRNEVEKIHVPRYPIWYQREGLVIWEE